VTADESWREYGPSPLSGILRSALDAFAERGYDATSIRDIAAGAGLSVPGVYHHHASKQQILTALMEVVLQDLLARCRGALASAERAPGAGPQERFDALAECLIRYHMFRRAESFVASTELRSLDADNRAHCVALRDELQQLLADAIREGCAGGVFATPYPDDAARAVSTLCVGIATWYREDGPLAPEEVVRRQLVLARALPDAS
jgi:AcrR family transcriptional regulator